METQTQERDLKMHSNLLYLTIQRQAGTLAKAVMEGVMNLVDAKATAGKVTLTREKLIIEDDGQGFRNMNEIDEWFEHFGQPHDASENKTYGEFRMGRGQIFVFGENEWRSGGFKMNLDFKNRGIKYDLTTGLEQHKGCRIEVKLYKMLSQGELRATLAEVEQLCKYVAVPVTLNGLAMTVDPATEQWDHVTDDAYVRLKKSGDLHVYHLGAYVKSFSNWSFGYGGVIVGKNRFLLNMARNDILISDCKVWRRVKTFFANKADAKTRKSTSMNESQRQRMADRLIDDDLEHKDMLNLRLFTSVKGTHYSAEQLRWQIAKYQGRYSSSAHKCRIGVKAMKSMQAFVFSADTLERFHVDNPQELITMLRNRLDVVDGMANDWAWVDFNEMSEGITGSHILLEDDELSPTERLWQRALTLASNTMHWQLRRNGALGGSSRSIVIGTSDTTHSWTDGATYVAFSRELLKLHDLNFKGILATCTDLLHAYCHDVSDVANHSHDQEFLERFHDNQDALHEAAADAWQKLPGVFEQMDRQMSQKLLRDRDKADQLADSVVSTSTTMQDREAFDNEQAA